MRRGLVAASLVAAVAVVPSAPAQAGCAAVTARGPWTAVRSPFDATEVSSSFPSNSARSFHAAPYSTVSGTALTGFRVDPDLPSRVLATDGVAIHRSLDGGCTWTKVYSLAEVDAGPRTAALSRHVLDITVVHTGLPAAKQRMYALAIPSGFSSLGGPATVDLLVSGDGGATWTKSTGPGGCGESWLAVPARRPTTVYLDCWNSATDEPLYVSTDAGAHWTKRTPKGFAMPWAKGGFGASPVNPDEVWAAGMAYGPKQYKQYWTVLRSTDGGTTFQTMMQSLEHTSFYEMGLALAAAPGGRTAVVVWNADALLEFQAPKKWRWLVVPTPSGQAGAIEYVSFGADAAHLFLVGGYGVANGHEVYKNGPSCTEGQRVLAYDMRSRKWSFGPAPVVSPAHVGYALFGLQAVPGRGGVDYWVRESGYRDGDCRVVDGVQIGPRESYLMKFRAAS